MFRGPTTRSGRETVRQLVCWLVIVKADDWVIMEAAQAAITMDVFMFLL